MSSALDVTESDVKELGIGLSLTEKQITPFLAIARNLVELRLSSIDRYTDELRADICKALTLHFISLRPQGDKKSETIGPTSVTWATSNGTGERLSATSWGEMVKSLDFLDILGRGHKPASITAWGGPVQS